MRAWRARSVAPGAIAAACSRPRPGAAAHRPCANPPPPQPRSALYQCNYCHRDVSNEVRIKCADCQDFDLCLDCYAVGAEVAPHKNSHRRGAACPTPHVPDCDGARGWARMAAAAALNAAESSALTLAPPACLRPPDWPPTHRYRVVDDLSFPLLHPDWGADEELLLLEGIDSEPHRRARRGAFRLIGQPPPPQKTHTHTHEHASTPAPPPTTHSLRVWQLGGGGGARRHAEPGRVPGPLLRHLHRRRHLPAAQACA